MKTKSLVLMAVTLMCVSCSWEEYTDSPEMRKAYLQTHGESQDSTVADTGDNDTTYVDRYNPKGIAESNTMEEISPEDSVRCNLIIEGKLIVDGGTSSDISDTYVTVEKITVNVWADGKGMKTYYPEAHKEVAEPSESCEWNNMPAGVDYDRKRLNMEPLAIPYKNYFYAEVTVCYVLRVKDNKLATGCTKSRFKNTVKCSSDRAGENNMSVLVTLELSTVQFDATVGNYE